MSLASLHDKLITLLTEGVAERVYTQASVAVVRSGRLIAQVATHDVNDVFDVASVTKVATAVLALKVLPWSTRTAALLSHSSGFPPWRPFFALAARELDVSLETLISTPALHASAKKITQRLIAETEPSSPVATYSDLNFLALGFAIEERVGGSLPVIAQAQLFQPLGARSMRWGGLNPGAVPTGQGRPRSGNPKVEVEALPATPYLGTAVDHAADDDNAASMGGACGHAGLWSDAMDLARLGDLMRQACEGSDTRLLPKEAAQRLFTKARGSSRTYGLDTPSGETPSIGSLLGRGAKGAAGHLGFTGCSLWIDRDAELSIAFLSNSVVVERPNPRIRSFRPRLHDVIATELRGEAPLDGVVRKAYPPGHR